MNEVMYLRDNLMILKKVVNMMKDEDISTAALFDKDAVNIRMQILLAESKILTLKRGFGL